VLMSPEGYIVSSVILAVIGVVGCLCNGVVLLIYFKDKQLWTPLNLLLLNLVIGDFSVSILGTPITFSASLARRWFFGDTMCSAYGFFMALLGITSISTLTVLSFERYMMISRPFGVGGLSRRGALGLIAAAWLYSLALTAPPLFGWGEYTNEAANISCSINWETQSNHSTSYIIFLFVFGLLVPVVVIVWSYVNIIFTIRYNTIRIGQVTRAQQRIGIMVALMVAAFLFSWTPYAGFSLYAAFGDPRNIGPGLAVAPALFAKSSICYNPFIYVMLNTQFRASWKRLWGSHSCDTSLEAGVEPSVPGEVVVTQQTTAGYASPETPLRRTANLSDSLDDDDASRTAKRGEKRAKLQERQRLRQLKEMARKQSRYERQLEKELERHERDLDLQREKQERLEEKRRRKEDSLKRLQQQQFSAKFHPACLVALVTDPRNNAVLSVKMGDGVSRHSGPSFLARCFGKQDAAGSRVA
ncbi:pinopsin-like, partial [Thrips palmi]|uniref:Pinopsin-like n=1 Tax=Thrips palmi TaxID=161013 RepID=A0A6P8YMT4_THRPL